MKVDPIIVQRGIKVTVSGENLVTRKQAREIVDQIERMACLGNSFADSGKAR